MDPGHKACHNPPIASWGEQKWNHRHPKCNGREAALDPTGRAPDPPSSRFHSSPRSWMHSGECPGIVAVRSGTHVPHWRPVSLLHGGFNVKIHRGANEIRRELRRVGVQRQPDRARRGKAAVGRVR